MRYLWAPALAMAEASGAGGGGAAAAKLGSSAEGSASMWQHVIAELEGLQREGRPLFR